MTNCSQASHRDDELIKKGFDLKDEAVRASQAAMSAKLTKVNP